MMHSIEVLSSLLISDVKDVPSNNINPIFDLPRLSELDASDDSIPLIDLDGLNGPNRSHIINQIGQACEEIYISLSVVLRVKNHGIPVAMINNIQSTEMKFFKLPNDQSFNHLDPAETIRLTAAFNSKNQKGQQKTLSTCRVLNESVWIGGLAAAKSRPDVFNPAA
ncbi:hypothetical protein SADUNF_Sadunf16G0295300 [Salix dunnii]|uniref:Non-haem dioxygenase N-terminal domain-containing protein n=1 Tax=Salix dunnii TaxID=1413687 RepID=A0A835JCY2_9ROSI|nr:hypothetical protein SADUNF_Sadunf16G0295300 [Salix dunnii]